MSRLKTLLALSLALTCGAVVQAQSCTDGACKTGPRADGIAPLTTQYREAPADYGYSRFSPPAGFTNQTDSFSQICRDCGAVHDRAYGSQGYDDVRARGIERERDRDYDRVRGYDYGRDYDRVRDYDRNQGYDRVRERRYPDANLSRDSSGVRGFDMNRAGNGPIYRPRDDYDFGSNSRSLNARSRGRYEQGFRGFSDRDRGLNGRGFDDGFYTPRNSAPNLRYPSFDRGYGYTSTRQNRRPAVNWYTDLNRASRFVQTNRRPMLVNVTADWCSHCTRMKDETFTDARFLQMLTSSGVVPVRLDADANRELVAKIGIRSLPTTLIVTPDLKIQERLQGFRSAEQLTESLRRYTRNVKADTDVKVAAR